MFNLLPNKIKYEIKMEYRIRLLVIILFFIIVIQISFLIFLFPSWLVSFDKEKEIIFQTKENDSAFLDFKISEINSSIESINTKLTAINSELKYPTAVSFVDNILSQKIPEISIEEITYTVLDEKTGTIFLAGKSLTRESLVSFVKKLESLKIFKNVDLPISNLTKDKNINFSITANITP